MHGCREQDGIVGKSILILQQVPAEISVSCRSLRGDDGKPVGQRTKPQSLLHVHEPFPAQPLYRLAAESFPGAQGKLRVDIGDVYGKAVDFMIGDLAQGKDLLPHSQRRPGHRAEMLAYRIVSAAPYRRPALCRHAPRSVLGQFEVAVADGSDLEAADLSLHPDTLAKSTLQRSLDVALEGQKVYVFYSAIHGIPKIRNFYHYSLNNQSGMAVKNPPTTIAGKSSQRYFLLFAKMPQAQASNTLSIRAGHEKSETLGRT